MILGVKPDRHLSSSHPCFCGVNQFPRRWVMDEQKVTCIACRERLDQRNEAGVAGGHNAKSG
jgi:hypothetical protein